MKEIDKEKQYEKLLGIRTTGRDDSNSDEYRYPYEPTPYCVLERLSRSGYIGKRNTLLDYGCGKGRVDFFLAYETKCRAVGIEYDERIYQAAISNKEKALSGNRVTLVNQDASTYEVPAEADRIFFFNPFSVDILKTVLHRIFESYYNSPREILMFFYFPSDEYISQLMTTDGIMFEDEISCNDLFTENGDRERIMIFSIN